MAKTPILKKAYDRGIEASGLWTDGITKFWELLTSQKDYDPNDREMILKKFCQDVQEKNQHLLIAVYNVDALVKIDIENIFKQFWMPFKEMMQQESLNCVLLLMGKTGWTRDMSGCFPQGDPSTIPLKV